jgi:hypothetical protein
MNASIRRVSAMAALALFMISACGSATSTGSALPSAVSASKAPSLPAPSPSAAPTPVDAVPAFLQKVASPSFAGRSDVTGHMKVADQSFAIEGSLDVNGPNSHTLLSIAAPGQAPQEAVTVDGATFTKTGSVWYAAPVQARSNALGDALRSPGQLTDVGVVDKDGRSLHDLKPSANVIDPALLGLTASSISNATGTIEFYVTEDGSLVVMDLSATWTQKADSGSVPASMALEFAFSCTGCAVSITAPDPIFKTFTSKLFHYKVGAPEDWDAVLSGSSKKPDYFESADATFLAGSRASASGMNLNEWVKTLIACDKITACAGWTAYRQESNVAAQLDGVAARRISFQAIYKGTTTYQIVVVAVRSGYTTILELNDNAGHERADRVLMDQIVGTFAFN